MSNDNRVSDERLADEILEGFTIDDGTNVRYAVLKARIIQSLRSKPVAGVEVKPLSWKDYRGDGSRQAKTPYGEVLWATPNGWGNRHFPEQFKGSGLEANMAAAEANHQAIILSTLSLPAQEPVAWRTWAVLSNRWIYTDHATAEGLPLYASPQPEAVINDEMVERFEQVYSDECDHRYDRQAIRAALTAALKKA